MMKKFYIPQSNSNPLNFMILVLFFLCVLGGSSCKGEGTRIININNSIELPFGDKLGEVDFFSNYLIISLERDGTTRINGTLFSEKDRISNQNKLPVILAFDKGCRAQDLHGLFNQLSDNDFFEINIAAIDRYFNEIILVNIRIDNEENVKTSKMTDGLLEMNLNSEIKFMGKKLSLDKLGNRLILESSEYPSPELKIQIEYANPMLLMEVINLARRANIRRIVISTLT